MCNRYIDGHRVISIMRGIGEDDISILKQLGNDRIMKGYGFESSDQHAIDKAYKILKDMYPQIRA